MPSPVRKTVAQWLDMTGNFVAKLILMLFGVMDEGRSLFRVYPTRLHFAAMLRTAFKPFEADWTGGMGLSLKQVFADAWDYLKGAGASDSALAYLNELYERILSGEAWTGSEAQIERAVAVLASVEADSLWTLAVQRGFPEHPQTPGSAKWVAEEEKAQAQGRPAHHESDANPFT